MLSVYDINQIFAKLDENIQAQTTELNYDNNFTLLIAVVLSAQAKDSAVNKVTEKLFKTVQTPNDVINLGIEGLREAIRSLGLFANKAKHIMALSYILVEKYNGVVPNSYDKLIKLPGVGRKTANVVLNVAFNMPTIPVDTHVFRVARRIGLSQSDTILLVEKDLLANVPKKYMHIAHHLLILHGRYTCKARGYDCTKCCIKHLCQYENKKLL